MIITNAKINEIVDSVEKINGKEIVKAWEPSFTASAKCLLTFARICEAVSKCYQKVAKNNNAKEALAILIDRVKVHLSVFIKSCLTDVELLSAAGEFNTQVEGDFAPLQKEAERIVKDLMGKPEKPVFILNRVDSEEDL